MPISDHKYFNCSEEHELNYVAGLYKKSKKVEEELKKICEKKKGENLKLTHEEVYEILDELGYEKK